MDAWTYFIFKNEVLRDQILQKINMLGWTLFFWKLIFKIWSLILCYWLLFVSLFSSSHATYLPTYIHSITYIFLSLWAVPWKLIYLYKDAWDSDKNKREKMKTFFFQFQCCMNPEQHYFISFCNRLVLVVINVIFW